MNNANQEQVNALRGIPNIKHWTNNESDRNEVQAVVTTRQKFDAEKQRLIRKSRQLYESMMRLNAERKK